MNHSEIQYAFGRKDASGFKIRYCRVEKGKEGRFQQKSKQEFITPITRKTISDKF